jgi:hypothetical protein
VAEELRPTSSVGLRGDNENIWHIAAAERWSDGQLIGHRTYCGRNYSQAAQQSDLAGVDDVCSDCRGQVARRH